MMIRHQIYEERREKAKPSWGSDTKVWTLTNPDEDFNDFIDTERDRIRRIAE